jgi:hypothetical protein
MNEGREKAIEELLHQEVYAPEEAASLLDMDVQRLYAAAFRGELKARIVGRDVVSIRRADLIDWLRAQR